MQKLKRLIRCTGGKKIFQLRGVLAFLFVVSSSVFLTGFFNLEREVKNFVRPVGRAFNGLRESGKDVFRPPMADYHIVRGDTLHQKRVAPGRIGANEAAVALPDRGALYRRVRVYYPKTGRSVRCLVKDTGPWFVRDPYWNFERGPLAEKLSTTPTGEKITYRSGISLSPEVWYRLGVPREMAYAPGGVADVVGWRFIYSDDEPTAPRAGQSSLPPQQHFERPRTIPPYDTNRPWQY
jgi:hypothetical protein